MSDACPDHVCSLCYHDKATANTCNRPDCSFSAATGSVKWTYNRYRATLLRNGERFAIVTPDGRDRLTAEGERDLLDALNAPNIKSERRHD